MLESSSTKSGYLDFVESQFKQNYLNKGYIQEDPVAISSKVDRSVAFVGATVSSMKKYVLDSTIGKRGRFLIQNCLRTQGIPNLCNTKPSVFGSYFKGMGILAEPGQLNKATEDVFDYLVDYLKIPEDEVRIRISSQDKDLLEAIEPVDKGIVREIDTFPEKYYKHRYGMDDVGIIGRNFNISVRKNGTDDFLDIGNIIVMESSKRRHAIEMGLGNQTLSMCRFGSDSTIHSSRMADVFNIDSVEKQKFADAIIAVSVMQNEDIKNRPRFSKYFKNQYNAYNEAIAFWRSKLQVGDEQIVNYMNQFMTLEYKTDFKGENTWKVEK